MKETYYWKFKDSHPFEVVEISGNTLKLHSTYNYDSIEIEEDSIINTIFQKSIIYKKSDRVDFYLDQTELEKSNISIGEYFPRIYRSIFDKGRSMMKINVRKEKIDEIVDKLSRLEELIEDSEPQFSNLYSNTILSCTNQLNYLIDRINSIFRVIHPTENNLMSYGTEIRNVILLNCMEVETQLKGILFANEYSFNNNFLTTKDYVKLKDVLHLDEYTLKLRDYPKFKSFSPFKNWDSQRPTNSLDWYSDYNKIKHDRENNFSRSSLKNALNSLAACFILLRAQYGDISYFKNNSGNFFKFEMTPTWSYKEDYIPPIKNTNWKKGKLIL